MATLSDTPLIPLPVEMANAEGVLYIDEEAASAWTEETVDSRAMAYLQRNLPATGFPLTTEMDTTLQLPAGSYLLNIQPDGVSISAGDRDGILNGAITLEQVMAFAGESERGIFLPCGTITDMPRFAYRGFMLDVARHFMGMDTLKATIDRIARYKVNHLHLHLTDDQGWRIEIKSWPKLTEVGSLTEVDGTPGGFYTQEEYREIIEYAADRGMTVVPEVDMPGHTNAAIVAYPELNGTDKPAEPHFGTEVGFSTFDTDKDVTYQFINDVVREIAEMTPGPYFHIGGDESHVTDHEDFVKFINQVQQIVKRHGKENIGWDEVASSSLTDGAVVQLWAHPEYALKAKQSGNQVLMSPATRTYLDMQYDSTSRIGLHWAAYIEVDSAYLWDPAAMAEGITDADILGLEAPLWTETVRSLEDIDYLVFPRLPALAEVAWTPQNQREWEDFKRRLRAHQDWLKEMGIGTYDTRVLK